MNRFMFPMQLLCWLLVVVLCRAAEPNAAKHETVVQTYVASQEPSAGRLNAMSETEAVAEIKKLGGRATVAVVSVDLASSKVKDSDLDHLKGLRELKYLGLACTQVTDAGVERLKEFTKLQELDLGATAVTDSGLRHLKGLAQLNYLGLVGDQITDDGLPRIEGLTRLMRLNLNDTKVSNAGLESLKRLTNLKELYLLGTQVTDAGVNGLHNALPNCTITYGTPPGTFRVVRGSAIGRGEGRRGQ